MREPDLRKTSELLKCVHMSLRGWPFLQPLIGPIPDRQNLKRLGSKRKWHMVIKRRMKALYLGVGGAAEILGGGAGYRLEGQRFGHT